MDHAIVVGHIRSQSIRHKVSVSFVTVTATRNQTNNQSIKQSMTDDDTKTANKTSRRLILFFYLNRSTSIRCFGNHTITHAAVTAIYENHQKRLRRFKVTYDNFVAALETQ